MSFALVAAALYLKGLTPAEKLVCVALADHYNNETGECCPSAKTIAADMDLSERSVRSAFAALVEKNLWAKEDRYYSHDDGGGRRSSKFKPLFSAILPDIGSPQNPVGRGENFAPVHVSPGIPLKYGHGAGENFAPEPLQNSSQLNSKNKQEDNQEVARARDASSSKMNSKKELSYRYVCLIDHDPDGYIRALDPLGRGFAVFKRDGTRTYNRGSGIPGQTEAETKEMQQQVCHYLGLAYPLAAENKPKHGKPRGAVSIGEAVSRVVPA